MQFRNPCKLCIIRPICRVRCPARQDFWDTRANITEVVSRGLIALSLITIMVSVFIY